MTSLREQLTIAQNLLSDVQHILAQISAAAENVAPVDKADVPVLPQGEFGLQQPAAFYDYIRGDAGELFPKMTAVQLQGVEALLAYGAGKLPLSWMAYCLATPYHETGKIMQGVKEGFNLSDAWRQKNLRYYPWYGRGLVQLTWEKNYKAASELVGENLIANPDLALDLHIGVKILIEGMLTGLFTGKKLRDYLPNEPKREQYAAARRIINGTDKADLIAGYAIEFEKALKLGDWR